ncbi:MAG: leucyl/phenylalanyl-tRNA--protein transferase [Gammaproteobacteria bacterium]|nr:leucyl/phenylalanyl-tRNA--protein transferase [Gammaproteobacteria bacterium]
MGFRVGNIGPHDAPDSFPDPRDAGIALGYPDGLIAIGGDLSNERLLAAYQRGIFPWYNDDQPVLWWSPDPRAIIVPAQFHMARRLARELRRGHWRYSLNQAFATVIDECGRNRGEHGTWITDDMRRAFNALNTAAYAHSIESWYRGELAGGLYGVRLGKIFFAESMYSARTSGSKVALSALVWIARQEGIEVIDCQLESEHLKSFGMRLLNRNDFLDRLPELTATAAPLPDWSFTDRDATELAGLRAV